MTSKLTGKYFEVAVETILNMSGHPVLVLDSRDQGPLDGSLKRDRRLLVGVSRTGVEVTERRCLLGPVDKFLN